MVRDELGGALGARLPSPSMGGPRGGPASNCSASLSALPRTAIFAENSPPAPS